jgi:type IV secretory pathway VirB9-like protein
MRTSALLLTTCLLAACAGGQEIPPPEVAYVPAKEIDPAAQESAKRVPVPITAENPIPAPTVKRFKSHEEATAAARKAATVTALEGTFEGAILNYVYQHGKRYRIVLDAPSEDFEQDGDATLLMLGPDDGVEPDSGFGDPSYFLVDKVSGGIDETSMRAKRDKVRKMSSGDYQTVLPLKCYKRGARTTMFVTSPRRTYLFDLHCARTNKSSGYNQAVQFTYQNEQVSEAPKAPRPAGSSRQTPIVADTHYAIEGPEEWRPREWSAWNDGANTHIRPSPAVTTRPVPLLSAATSFFSDPATGEYVITGLPSEIRFPWGESALVVRRTQK